MKKLTCLPLPILLLFSACAAVPCSTGDSCDLSTLLLYQSQPVILAVGTGEYVLSRDGGSTWKKGSMPTGLIYKSVGFDRGVYVAGESASGTVALSSDGGKSWSVKNSGATAGHSVVRGAEGTFLAVDISTFQVYRSNDGGSTWAASSSSFPAGFTRLQFRNRRWMGSGPNGPGVTYSDDGGKNWVLAGGLTTTQAMEALTVTPSGDIVCVEAGASQNDTYLSSDNGSNFSLIGTGGVEINGLTFMSGNESFLVYGNGRYIIASASNLMAISTDYKNWTQITTPAVCTAIADLTFLSDRFYMICGTNVLTSADGSSWTTHTTGASTSLSGLNAHLSFSGQ